MLIYEKNKTVIGQTAYSWRGGVQMVQ